MKPNDLGPNQGYVRGYKKGLVDATRVFKELLTEYELELDETALYLAIQELFDEVT